MDYILNKKVIPKTSSNCFIIKPASKTFITGICKKYYAKYDSEILSPYMSRQEYKGML